MDHSWTILRTIVPTFLRLSIRQTKGPCWGMVVCVWAKCRITKGRKHVAQAAQQPASMGMFV